MDEQAATDRLGFEQVLAEEIAHIRATRLDDTLRNTAPVDQGDLAGLALSGGGIRSASFALGVLQALVVEKALSRFQYLSTVSGGGYIGSALTWLLSQNPDAGLTAETFPLSGPLGGTRAPGVAEPRRRALDFIRQRGNYLVPSRSLSLMAGVAFVLRGLSATVSIYLAMVFAGLLIVQAGMLAAWHPTTGVVDDPVVLAIQTGAGHLALAALAMFFVLSALSWASPNTWFRPLIRAATQSDALAYLTRNLTTRWFGTVLTLLLAALGLAGLLCVGPMLNGDLVDALKPALLSGLGAAIATWATRPKPAATGRIPTLMIAATLVLVGFFWLAQLLGQLLLTWILSYRGDPIETLWWALSIAALVGGLALFVGRRINANDTSLHRFYRDRLMETFLPDAGNLASGKWEPAASADIAMLDQMCGAGRGRQSYAGPFHLINTNVVLTGSPYYRFSGRAGDSFLLSPLHVGSDATGWIATSRYTGLNRAVRGITLATAMATSGAAANPNAGVGGAGMTRSRLISLLMTLLNIRLGYWLVNPAHLADRKAARPPNLLRPAGSNMLGTGLREDRPFLQITDGGHFDNTGIYELIRRQCRLIVLSEAGADERFEFGDLASVIERIRVDFGANVDFVDGFGLEQLASRDRAAAGYAVARLRYAATGAEGFLVVIKPTLTAGLPADLYARRALFPTFPHETTADQFFNEAQFEAYRELGYRLGRRMIGDVGSDQRLEAVRQIWRL